jgi:hypothetical protein
MLNTRRMSKCRLISRIAVRGAFRHLEFEDTLALNAQADGQISFFDFIESPAIPFPMALDACEAIVRITEPELTGISESREAFSDRRQDLPRIFFKVFVYVLKTGGVQTPQGFPKFEVYGFLPAPLDFSPNLSVIHKTPLAQSLQPFSRNFCIHPTTSV